MNEYLTFGILAFTSFFTLINPFGVMPVFMTMTSSLSEAQRKKTARKATIVAFLTLLGFAFTGQLMFNFFGISVDSFRIAGGIIFFMVGYDMLQARLTSTKITDEEIEHKYVNDISITPLAIPMLCGPGAITNSIVLWEDSHSIGMKIAMLISILIMAILTYIVLWSASKIINFLGETGTKILTRLMGLIVMVIAVEFFFSGLIPFLQKI